MSLIQFLRILMARKAIILATLIACFIAAFITVNLLPKRYQASNRVLIDMSKPGIFAGPATRDAIGSYVSNQMKLIKDVQTIGLVVDNLGWAADPNYQAAFEAAGRPGGDIRDWLAQRIIDSTDAKFVDGSSIVEISYLGNDPASAQGIVQAIREAWLKANRDQRVSAAQRSAVSYDEQARRALAEVAKVEEERSQFAKANGILFAPGGVELESAKLGALSNATTAPEPPQVVPGAQSNPQVAMLQQQIAQAQQTLGPNHPTLQAMQRQLSVLRSTGGGGGATIIGGTTRAQIESAYQTQKARVLAQADKMDRLNQMEADIAVKRSQYQTLVGKSEEMKAMALGESPLEPLGNTNLPNQAVWPNKPLVLAGSIILGGALGVLLALLVELMARRVRGEADLEFASGVPVLAVVGQPKSDNFVLSSLRRLLDRDSASKRQALVEA